MLAENRHSVKGHPLDGTIVHGMLLFLVMACLGGALSAAPVRGQSQTLTRATDAKADSQVLYPLREGNGKVPALQRSVSLRLQDAPFAEALREIADQEGFGLSFNPSLISEKKPVTLRVGGSVRHAYPLFEEAMWAEIETFSFPRALDALTLERSTLDHAGVLGAAALGFGPESA